MKSGNLTIDEARDIAKASGFKDAKGNWIYPPDDGFLKEGGQGKIPVGTKLDRHGGYFDEVGDFKDRGHFFGKAGSDYSGRALPPGSDTKPLTRYEVIKEIEDAREGEATAWFGERGGNTQFQTTKSVDDLITEGYIVPVK